MLQADPLLPAEATTKIPAACVFSTITLSVSAAQPSLGGQPQLLFITCGRIVGSGLFADEVGRRDEPLEALGVGRGRAVALVHVAAADPLGAGRDADLVAGAVVTRSRTGGVGAVAVVVARHDGVGTADAPPPLWIESCQL